MIRYPGGRAIAIKNDVLLVEQDNRRMKGKSITNLEDSINRYFPSVPKDTVKRMVCNWKRDIEPTLVTK